tara:strand:+ start:111 stop:413 length:303 start_codon:yes stop_codon:yes gene_type:complete
MRLKPALKVHVNTITIHVVRALVENLPLLEQGDTWCEIRIGNHQDCGNYALTVYSYNGLQETILVSQTANNLIAKLEGAHYVVMNLATQSAYNREMDSYL